MTKSFWLGAGIGIFATSAFGQYSAWLPEPRQWIVTPSFVYSTFDEFWRGDDKTENPRDGESLDQYTGLLALEYGITPKLAADLTVGYTATDTDAFGGHSDNGLADTTFGLRYQFLDQYDGWLPLPTAAIRVGGIIEGTYDEDVPFSVGDGASGAETSLLLAKELFGGIGLFGDVGYRYRNHKVPDDFFGSAGAYAMWRNFTLTATYRHVQGLSGDDIDDPGFTFPEVKEVIQNIEAGLGYRDGGGRYYQFFYAHTIAGRNTGERDIFAVSATFPIGP